MTHTGHIQRILQSGYNSRVKNTYKILYSTSRLDLVMIRVFRSMTACFTLVFLITLGQVKG